MFLISSLMVAPNVFCSDVPLLNGLGAYTGEATHLIPVHGASKLWTGTLAVFGLPMNFHEFSFHRRLRQFVNMV